MGPLEAGARLLNVKIRQAKEKWLSQGLFFDSLLPHAVWADEKYSDDGDDHIRQGRIDCFFGGRRFREVPQAAKLKCGDAIARRLHLTFCRKRNGRRKRAHLS